MFDKKIHNRLVIGSGCIGMAFFGIAFLVTGAILPALKEALSLSMRQSASLVTFLPIGVLTGSLIFGLIADRFGYKVLFLLAVLCLLAGLLLLALVDNLSFLRTAVFFIGTGGGILNGATTALVSDVSDDSRRSSNLSILGVFYGLGAIAVPLLLGIFKNTGYSKILLAIAVFLFLTLLFFCFVPFPAPKQAASASKSGLLPLFTEPLLLLLSFVFFFQSALEGLCNNWTADYYIFRGFEESQASFALSFVVIGLTLCRLSMSGLLLKFSPRKFIWITLGITALGFALMYVKRIPPVVCTFITGFGLSATAPVVFSYLGKKYKENSGRVFSFALVVALCGNTLLNYLRGFVPMRFFPAYLLLSLALLMLLLAFSMPFLKNIDKQKE